MLFNIRNYVRALGGAAVLVSVAAIGSLVQAQTAAPSPAKSSKTQSGTTNAPDAQKVSDLNYVFEVGGQYRYVTGERPSKFEEYKNVRKGVLLRRGAIDYNPAGSPSYLTFAFRNASENDQQYRIEGGQYGRFRTTFTWNSYPLLYARGARSLFSSSVGGVYTVSDAIQTDLQNLDPPFVNAATTPNPALLTATRNYLAATSPFDLKTQREILTFEQRFNITSHWSVRLRIFDSKRTGQRPLGTGSYERTPTASGIGDVFRAHAIELPSEINYRTDNFTFGTSYLTRKWGVNFDYTFSMFRNPINAYIYDNPFRITDQQANTGGNFNRAAFARGIHSAMPDNNASGFLISGFADLPMYSRWAGAVGWSRWTQNEAFLPFTLNTAITAANLGGKSPTDITALPKASLEGEVDNLTVDQLLTSRPLRTVTFTFHYRAYEYKNKTAEIIFPGYAAYLESYWRTSIAGTYGTKLIANEPLSYLRQRASAEVIWDITKQLKWRGEYEWEGWNRTNRQASKTNEHKLGTFVSYRPTNQFKVDLDYHFQERTPVTYDPGLLEFNLLRMFDQSKRLRHDARFKVQWAVTPALGISADYAYLSDDYDQNFFGATRYVESRGGVDLLYNLKENTTVYANYSREHYRTSLQSIAKTGTPAFDLRNRWNRDDRNVNDNFGIGVTTYLANSKWFLDMNYAINDGRDLITTRNLTDVVPTAFTNATAYPFPEAKYRYQEFSIDSNYQIHEKVALGIRYYFEPFTLDDWQTNGLSPYPNDQLAPETDGRRFLLLDSRYTGHKGHIISFYIRFGN